MKISIPLLFCKFLIPILLMFTMIPGTAKAQSTGETGIKQLRKDIEKAQKLINNSIFVAVEKLGLIDDEKKDEFKNLPVREQEFFRWLIADTNLKCSKIATDEEQSIGFANTAIEKWKSYEAWYSHLNEQQIETLQRHPSRNQIKKAVEALEIAVEARGNRGDHKIKEIFKIYEKIRVEYFSSETALSNRTDLLLRCPAMKKQESEIKLTRRLNDLKRFCPDDDLVDLCFDEWDEYSNFLGDWVGQREVVDKKKDGGEKGSEDSEHNKRKADKVKRENFKAERRKNRIDMALKSAKEKCSINN